jgi:hypothetical protein
MREFLKKTAALLCGLFVWFIFVGFVVVILVLLGESID